MTKPWVATAERFCRGVCSACTSSFLARGLWLVNALVVRLSLPAAESPNL